VRDRFDYEIVKVTAHRPWPLPNTPWFMTQTWHDLLFAHWPVEPAQLRAVVPSAFELDLFDGEAWVGIVPFHMTNVAPRFIPALPLISSFPELNVRTYVRVGDQAGVYFFSLDAGSAIAVRAARSLLNLPYFRASMRVTLRDGAVVYESRREGEGHAEFRGTYGPRGVAFVPARGSLEYFLTERYCLYHIGHNGPYRLEIHHPPWLLQPAAADVVRNTMADASGLILRDRAPLLHFAKRQDMVAWPPKPL
jgi:uncharacterized protein YqjF (DUF2071 family)